MNDIQILIENEGIMYEPVLQDGVTWETERVGTPGKLTFSVINDNTQTEMRLNIQEGNRVTMRYKGQGVFTGFIFTKKRSKDQIIEVIAYDQLRYLKNKTSCKYDNTTATQLIKNLAAQLRLSVGYLEDTVSPVSRTDENQTYFDIILNALDDTARQSGEVYFLYDDFGKLALKNISNMKLDCLVSENTATDFQYETSIDSDTYNEVILYYNDEDTKLRRVFKVFDSYNMDKWGTLRLYEEIDNPEYGDVMATNYLKLYNSKRRTLEVKGVFGDIRARAGASVPVNLTLGDVNANSFLLIEKAKHTFKNNQYEMDLTLRGDVFV